MADPFSWAAIAATVGGTILQASSQMSAGRAAKKMGNLEKAEADKAAIQTNAVAQRKALEQRRRADIAGSRLQAVSAAQGGASDPTIVKLAQDIAGEGEYRALTELYEGEVDANTLTQRGNMAQYEGRVKNKTAQTNAYGTILSSAGSMYSKYGGGGSAGNYDSSIGSNGASSSTFRDGSKVNWYG